jgi:GAF domain-containing protein
VANGGRTVGVYQRAETFVTGKADRDPDELRGIKDTLGVRSTLGVPLHVGAQLRGVVLIASQEPDFWQAQDVSFMESVARWIAS